MASNRVERLQMRQRGAGTRKIKEVDFGFSLGFGPPADKSSQPASQPTNSQPDTAPTSQPLSLGVPPPAQDTTTTFPPQTQSLLSPTRTNANAAAHNQTIQRTPGSARNKLPPRPSTFDIPDENEPELERSSKRRRVGSPGDVSPSIGAQPGPTENNATEQPTIEKPTSPPQDQGVAIPIRTHSSNAPPNEEQPEPPSIPTNEADEPPAKALEFAETLEVETTEQPAPEPTRLNGTVSLPSDTSAGKRRGRKKKSPPSPSQTDIFNEERREEESTEAQPTETAQPEEPVEAPQDQEPVDAEPPKADGKRTRSQTPASVQPQPSPPVDEAQNDNAPSESGPNVTATKATRGRKKKDSTPAEEAVTAEVANVVADEVPAGTTVNGSTTRGTSDHATEEINEADNGKKRAGRPKKQISQPSEEPEEPSVSKRKRQREEQEEEQPAEAPAALSQSETETSRAGKRRKQRAEEEPARQEEQAAPEPAVDQPRAGRGRKRAERRPTPQDEAEPEAEVEARSSRAGKNAQAEQEKSTLNQEEHPGPEPEVAQPRAGKGRKRNERRPSPQADGEPEAEARSSRAGKEAQDTQEMSAREQERAEPEPQVKQPRAKKGRKRREEREQPAEEPPEKPEEQPDREAELEPQPQPEREQAKTKRGRGRGPAAEPEEPAQADNTQTQPRAPKRKREPRGETVPITVHRLANAASLSGEILESTSEDERESPDEISNKQTTKLPTRGGVNPADVLAQICRETLEKTITTLKNGIANENNTAKRAEWSLRRKAVEAFGSELEGRLFDLSQTLDSNFMLSAKVKKAKRNMMDLRARLDRVRREREAVALKMDAVRREHSKEEQAGLARSTINHSLHNLDLALERGQGRSAEDERLTAGLEFRLRNTARNVSSTAPGAQGGLLSQVKAFNAQLERQLAP
ncbi:hypothetical protein BDV19DRAFT_367111 [Aspergillus venezuelensis]